MVFAVDVTRGIALQKALRSPHSYSTSMVRKKSVWVNQETFLEISHKQAEHVHYGLIFSRKCTHSTYLYAPRVTG